MTVFEFDDYKKFVLTRLQESHEEGRGQLTKIANHLRVPPSTISLVFRGDRELTPDQASDLCVYLGLSSRETDYFLCLVDFSRAASKSLKDHLQRRMSLLKKESADVQRVVAVDKVLSANEKFVFYSDWYYSAIRLLTSTDNSLSPSRISSHLGIPIERATEILNFLITAGLCVQNDGRITMGPRSTHIGADDPLVYRHHRNWRELALNRLTLNQKLEPSELSLTYPCSISEKAMGRIKKEILAAIERVDAEMEKSSEDFVAYLNLDFFKL